jgi:endonuclease/exonuclease/phosphatase family metal-dependent hydrolase
MRPGNMRNLRYAVPTMRRALTLAVLLGWPLACSSSSQTDDPSATPPVTVPTEGGVVQPGEDSGTTPVDEGGVVTKPPVGQLGVLSLNLHCLKTDGTAFTTNEARFDAIAAAVLAEGVDIILAQEVCVSATANARSLLLAALQKTTGATWSSAIAFAHRAWEGTADEADENVAVFSRGALSASRELVHRAQSTLRRVTLGATIASPLKTATGEALPVRVYTVHLDHTAVAARAAQAREVAGAAMVETDDENIPTDAGGGAVALPLIVAGDFNAQTGADAPKALVDYGFVETSGSAQTTRIDHVFLHRSAPFAVASTKVLFTGGTAVSDHPGVLVRYAGAAPKPVRLTRIVATGSFGAPISLRGDRAPLSWERGWPAFARPASGLQGVAIVTSEISAGAFAYKFLQNDSDWANGGNVSGAGEKDNASAPTF